MTNHCPRADSCAAEHQRANDNAEKLRATTARAEQAERQVREALSVADELNRRGHERPGRAGDAYASAEALLRAALSGVSGPEERPAKKRWISDREYEIGNDGPTTEGARSDWGRWVRWTTRNTSGTVVGLSCGHAVLRRPNWQIPLDMKTECEECAVARPTTEGASDA